MSAIDAAIAALYPVIVLLGAMVWSRYLSVVTQLEPPMRTLVCSLLVMVGVIVAEQIYYGLGRLTNQYIQISMKTEVIAFMKLGYVVSFCYMLYAFWMLAPAKPKLWVPIAMAAMVWIMIIVAMTVR